MDNKTVPSRFARRMRYSCQSFTSVEGKRIKRGKTATERKTVSGESENIKKLMAIHKSQSAFDALDTGQKRSNFEQKYSSNHKKELPRVTITANGWEWGFFSLPLLPRLSLLSPTPFWMQSALSFLPKTGLFLFVCFLFLVGSLNKQSLRWQFQLSEQLICCRKHKKEIMFILCSGNVVLPFYASLLSLFYLGGKAPAVGSAAAEWDWESLTKLFPLPLLPPVRLIRLWNKWYLNCLMINLSYTTIEQSL